MKSFRSFLEEDGGAVGAVSAAPTNVTGSAIAAGPSDIGVNPKKKKTPVMFKPPFTRKG